MNESFHLSEMARFLWFLNQRPLDNIKYINVMDIIDLCNERAGISSYSPRPYEVLFFLEELGIINQIGRKLKIHISFIELLRNSESPLYLNNEQKDILFEIIFLHRKIGPIYKKIISNCYITDDKSLIIPSDTIQQSDDYTRGIIRILQEIDVIKWEDGIFYLNKDKLKISEFTGYKSIPLDESTLNEIIEFQKKMARLAEEYIVEWEKHRLENQGDKNLIDLIRRVSSENVNLGYDVVSVDGGENEVNDRFIEVKSSLGTTISFFWTSNEIKCARKYGEKYWIYFVPRANTLPLKKPIIYIIRNPVSHLGKTLKYVERKLEVWYDSSMYRTSKRLILENGLTGVFL